MDEIQPNTCLAFHGMNKTFRRRDCATDDGFTTFLARQRRVITHVFCFVFSHLIFWVVSSAFRNAPSTTLRITDDGHWPMLLLNLIYWARRLWVYVLRIIYFGCLFVEKLSVDNFQFAWVLSHTSFCVCFK